MEQVIFKNLGQIDYQEAWDLQTGLHKSIVASKVHNRDLVDGQEPLPRKHYLLVCEHPHVFTLGKSGKPEHLLLSEVELKEREAVYYKINRGGDITYHGPGQLVAYPIFDLDGFFTDVHKYVRFLEEVVIRTLATFGLKGERVPDYTGVWLAATAHSPNRKICAIGVHLSRWVTMHGFALNVNTNLDYFNFIIPCGINESDKAVTSMEKELGFALDRETVLAEVKKQFKALFEFEYYSA